MKIFAIFILLIISPQIVAQEKSFIERPEVDKRIELMSIVFRLAGNREYNTNDFKLYTDRIEQHFTPYKNHELILFAKELRNDKGISYDAPMSLAISLDDKLNPIREFSENSLSRWSKSDADKFTRLLKTFYIDAGCADFFNNNRELYEEVSDRFASVYVNMNLGWYSAFYGNEPAEKFKVALASGNGGNCYGPSVINSDGDKEIYAIMGIWEFDDSGMPVFSVDDYLSILIHEFNHSFVNLLLEKNKELFRANGERIFEALNYEMSVQQAYGSWETVLNEALVRAAVVKYYIDQNADQSVINNLFKRELDNGFLWIKELTSELEEYGANRETYPTLESYMPKLAQAYTSYADLVERFDNKRPKVVSIDEFENESTNVNATLKTITIHFDRPLKGEGYSVFLGKKGRDAFPKVENIQYMDGNKSIVMKVLLEVGKEYQFVLTGKHFKTQDGFPLKMYTVNFKTEK